MQSYATRQLFNGQTGLCVYTTVGHIYTVSPLPDFIFIFFSNFHSHSSSVAAPPSLSHYRIEISRGIDDEDRLTCIRRVASTYIQYLRSRFPHPTDAKWTPFILCIEFSVKYIGANKTKEGRRICICGLCFLYYVSFRN